MSLRFAATAPGDPTPTAYNDRQRSPEHGANFAGASNQAVDDTAALRVGRNVGIVEVGQQRDQAKDRGADQQGQPGCAPADTAPYEPGCAERQPDSPRSSSAARRPIRPTGHGARRSALAPGQCLPVRPAQRLASASCQGRPAHQPDQRQPDRPAMAQIEERPGSVTQRQPDKQRADLCLVQ